MSRPKIGITGPDEGGAAAWIFTALSVFFTGGRPVRIRPGNSRRIDQLCGLILGGGADIDPTHYQGSEFIEDYLQHTIKNKKKSFPRRILLFFQRLSYPMVFIIRKWLTRKFTQIDKDRDKMELELLDQAMQRRLPVLGICRGMQLINVYFKGNLFQDIQEFYNEELNRLSIFPVKKVLLTEGSNLRHILRVRWLKVNALHHQAVKDAGTDIQVVGIEPNGIVQAIESTAHPFVIGVQWHPEYLIRKKVHRRLFKALIANAKKTKTILNKESDQPTSELKS